MQIKPDVRLSGLEPEGDKLYVSLNDRYAEYTVESLQAGTFSIEARIFHSGGKQELKVWLGVTDSWQLNRSRVKGVG